MPQRKAQATAARRRIFTERSSPYHNAAMRFIAHVDMDAFYASVELLRYPELRGKPLVIGGRRRTASEDGSFPTLREYKGRGVITTATYEARAFGVHSGMALILA